MRAPSVCVSPIDVAEYRKSGSVEFLKFINENNRLKCFCQIMEDHFDPDLPGLTPIYSCFGFSLNLHLMIKNAVPT